MLARTFRKFTDSVQGDPFSGVELLEEYDMGPHLRGEEDTLLGLNILYDGYLVFSTARGIVGVISRDFTNVHTVELSEDEEISNMMAVDENGGIYVVTSKFMHRVQWNGATLSIQWTSSYEAGVENQAAGRLGAGSGSTPSLMGTKETDDRFVVITDGGMLMNLVLFWRDEIPDDWEPIAEGKDRRIAAEVPVTFGNPTEQESVSEQSVLVRGYGAVVVNNNYGITFPSFIPDLVNQLFVLFTNLPFIAPHGAEKFEWDPDTRTLGSVWVNSDVSCPNGIPTMSTASNLAYCIGQKWSAWTIEAFDWDTGESAFRKRLGFSPGYNSAYAALEVGPNHELVTGTVQGVVRVELEDNDDSSCSIFNPCFLFR